MILSGYIRAVVIFNGLALCQDLKSVEMGEEARRVCEMRAYARLPLARVRVSGCECECVSIFLGNFRRLGNFSRLVCGWPFIFAFRF